jgi:hypothetical protein
MHDKANDHVDSQEAVCQRLDKNILLNIGN